MAFVTNILTPRLLLEQQVNPTTNCSCVFLSPARVTGSDKGSGLLAPQVIGKRYGPE